VRTQDFVQTKRLPEVHDVLHRMRLFVDAHAPDTVLISEAYLDEPSELLAFYGGPGDEAIHLPFNFFLAQVPAFDALAFRRAIERVEAALGPDRWPSQVLSNHDIDRACDRFAAGAREHTDAIARLLAIVLLTVRGSPFIYYGEEIGMRTEPPATLDEVRDPVGRVFWPRYKGRDGVRRPMPWTAGPGAGFTNGRPWLALPSDAGTRNVAAQTQSPSSLLMFYRSLLDLRRRSPALRDGGYRGLASSGGVLAFERSAGADRAIVLANMSTEAARPGADLPSTARVTFGTHRAAGTTLNRSAAVLEPFEGMILTT
jgi:alpha-glucosidase